MSAIRRFTFVLSLLALSVADQSFAGPIDGAWEGKLEKSGAIVSTKISDLETFRRTDSLSPRCSCLFTSPATSGCYF